MKIQQIIKNKKLINNVNKSKKPIKNESKFDIISKTRILFLKETYIFNKINTNLSSKTNGILQ